LAEPKKGRGFTLWKWDGEEWGTVDGIGAITIAVGKNGRVYITTSQNKILYTDDLEREREKCHLQA